MSKKPPNKVMKKMMMNLATMMMMMTMTLTMQIQLQSASSKKDDPDVRDFD